MMRRALTLLTTLALSGCAVGPNYHTPKSVALQTTTLTEAQGSRQVTTAPLPEQWWRLFDDPVLDRLVEKALEHNTDIRSAAANLQRARAVLSQSRASLLPDTTISAQATRSRSTQSIGAFLAGGPVTGNYYTAGLDASYEIDLFGGVRRSIEAAKGDYQVAGAQLDAARVSIVAETARTYAAMCGYAAQASVARETATLQRRTLDLTQRLLSAGRGTQRDVDQADVLVQQADAQVPSLDAERRASLYALAVLTGDPPEQFDQAAAACAASPTVKIIIPVGDGQAMLARRPDVRSAERQLAADTARIGVATAALFPSVTFLGAVSVGGVKVGDLGSDKSLNWSFGPLVSWKFPLNGAARARVRQSKAVADGSLAAFDKAVLTALQETEQAMARLAGATDKEASLGRAAASSEDAARISRLRFQEGSDSFLQLLDAERSRATARAQYAQAQSDRATAQVALFKALGGGWENAPAVAVKPAQY